MACLQARCGWWRWVVTFATFMEFLLAFGPLYNYSVLFLSLQKEFHSSSANTGWLGSLAVSMTFLFSPVTSLLEQKLSKRTLVLVGVAVYCAGLLVTSFVPALAYAYLTFGVATGVGGNLMMHSSMELLLDWFARKNFSRSSAGAQMGTTAGMLAFGYLLTTAITRYGWRSALKILSGGIFVVGTTVGLLLTNPPTERYVTVQNQAKDQEHAMEVVVSMNEGQEGCGEETKPREAEDGKPDVKEVDYHMHNESSQDSRVNSVNCRGMLAVMKDLEPWLWSAGNMLCQLGWTFFNINFASFMEGLDLNSDQIASGIMLFAGGELCGKMLIAVVGDRLPFMYLYLLIASCVAGIVTLGLLTLTTTFLTVALLAVASGFMRSGVYATIFAAAAELFLGDYGTNNVMLLSNVPTGVGILVSAPLSGGLYDATGDYILSLLVIAAIFFCAAAVWLFIPLRRKIRSRSSCCSPVTDSVPL